MDAIMGKVVWEFVSDSYICAIISEGKGKDPVVIFENRIVEI